MSEDRLSPHGEAPSGDRTVEKTGSSDEARSEENPSGENDRPPLRQRLHEEAQDFEFDAQINGASGKTPRKKKEPERIPLSIIMSYPTEVRRGRLWDRLLIIGLLLAFIVTIYLLWAR